MNRVWMITGAGRGLGHAFAEEAVKNGEKVIATVRKINDTDPLMKNENVLPVIMDVTKKEEVAAAVDAGIRKFGRIEKEYIDNWYTCFAAGAVLISIPIAILFLRMQKYYVNGLSGGVKG